MICYGCQYEGNDKTLHSVQHWQRQLARMEKVNAEHGGEQTQCQNAKGEWVTCTMGSLCATARAVYRMLLKASLAKREAST